MDRIGRYHIIIVTLLFAAANSSCKMVLFVGVPMDRIGRYHIIIVKLLFAAANSVCIFVF